MVREADQSEFQRRLEERRAQRASLAPPPQPQLPQWDQAVVLQENIDPAERELDEFVNKIDIVDAYNKFCGKMRPDTSGKREGIMVSCPNPRHRDSNPSAWINLDKQTYFCGGCQEGGDAHDIAALNLGYPVPGYKSGETFHKLRQDMATAFGFRSKRVAGGETVTWVEPQPEGPSNPGPEGNSSNSVRNQTHESPEPYTNQVPDSVEAEVAKLYADEEEEPEIVSYPTINWRNIVPEDTFLFEYMKACTNDDAPEEYHFWHGLLALGLVGGRRVTLDDTQPVFGNLLLCILGATGTGKSRSRRHLVHVLREVVPYHEDGTATSGVKIVPVPGSGEHLVSEFNYEGKDPTNNLRSLGPQPVTGLVDFDEMAALLSRANRQGSTLKTTLMQMADAVPEVSIGSLTRGNFVASESLCSITASTQPRALRTIINRTDTSSGFLNRWVFAGGKSKQIEVLGGDRSQIRVDLAAAIEELKSVHNWTKFPKSIKMDDDAFKEYEKFFRTSVESTKNRDQTDLLKRIDLLTKKLMLLLTINLQRETVPLSVVQAIQPLFEYMIQCYGILNSNIGVTLMQDVMTDILRHIERHQEQTKRGATARDIARYTHRKNYSLEQIKKALDVMMSLDLIELAPKANGAGRPAVRYQTVTVSA